MSVFKKISKDDVRDSIVSFQPSYVLTSGSSGWRGGPEGSGSISLYEGTRGSGGVVTRATYRSDNPLNRQIGDPTRTFPITASIHNVFLRNEVLNFAEETNERWGKEHWDPMMLLYDHYSSKRADYTTASFSHYSVYFNKDSLNIISFQDSGQLFHNQYISGSFTVESWVKPFLTQSLTNDFTIMSMNRAFWLGITGSTGDLIFSSSQGSFQSPVKVPVGSWSHVAVSFDESTASGSFIIDGVLAGSFPFQNLVKPIGFTSILSVGQVYTGPIPNLEFVSPSQGSGMPRKSFHGLIGETRMWTTKKSQQEISGSAFSSIRERLPNMIVASCMCEGPLFDPGTFDSNEWPFIGSGTVNFSVERDINSVEFEMGGFGYMNRFDDRVGPSWVPNDNPRYFVPKHDHLQYIRSLNVGGIWKFNPTDVSSLRVINVPSAFYGRQIVPGSVKMTCRGFSAQGFDLERVLVDDSNGGLIVSGGLGWNKVGNVFYSEGLIVIKDPSLLDFGTDQGAFVDPDSTLEVSFKGDSRIPTKTVTCRIEAGEINASSNSSFSIVDGDDRLRRNVDPRVTTIGLYDRRYRLVAVVRLAQPIRVRSKSKMSFRIRIDG